MTIPRTLIDVPESISLSAQAIDLKRPDIKRRYELPDKPDTAIQINVQARTKDMPGVPGRACAIFFNIEYETGPIFWDTFCFPDTGSTAWRWYSCEVMARGPIRCIEMHVRLQGKGTLEVRQVRVEAIEPKPAADLSIAMFGDSTDMTCYLPSDFRLSRRLELLMRDRFIDHTVDVHCMSEGGEYLKRLLETGRLERELKALSTCDIATIRYGLNDAPQKIEPADFAQQLQTACEMIHAHFPNAAIVLATTIPELGDPYKQSTVDIATKLKLPLIRMDEMMRTSSAAGDSDWHIGEGSMIGRRNHQYDPADPTGLKGDLHPNAHGSQMLAECYYEHLEPIAAKILGNA